MSPVSQGNTTPGGPLNVPGVPIPTSPVVYRNPSARERAEKEDKR